MGDSGPFPFINESDTRKRPQMFVFTYLYSTVQYLYSTLREETIGGMGSVGGGGGGGVRVELSKVEEVGVWGRCGIIQSVGGGGGRVRCGIIQCRVGGK